MRLSVGSIPSTQCTLRHQAVCAGVVLSQFTSLLFVSSLSFLSSFVRTCSANYMSTSDKFILTTIVDVMNVE